MTKRDKNIFLKTASEIELIRQSADILGRCHGLVASMIKPGVSTISLDKAAYQFIKDNGAKPSFLNYGGFKYSLCISVNNIIVHGEPSDYILKDGDIVSVDGGVYYQGFHSDSAFTYPVGTVAPKVLNLCKVTYESLFEGLKFATTNYTIGDIGFAIQQHAQRSGYSVVRELVGHGVGASLHEAPNVPNYGKRNAGMKLEAGMVLAIEPMINFGVRDIKEAGKDWSQVLTADNKPSAHYEHTVAITEDGKPAEILTTFKYIDEGVIKRIYG